MADPDFLAALGWKTQDIVAGLSGGIVNALIFRQSNPVGIISSILIGALTANYLAEYGAKYTGTSEGTAAFLVGLCGMVICQLIVSKVPQFVKGPDDKRS